MRATASAFVTRDEGRVVVSQPFPFAGRIFGLLFLLPGLKLLWDMASALRQTGLTGWGLSELPGLAIWLFFVLVFLLPGWAIATIRRRIEIDRGHRHLRQINDFLVYRWSKTRPLGDFTAVRVFRPRRTSSRSGNIVHYHVELIAGAGDNVLIFMDQDDDAAAAVAKDIAALTGLPLKDNRARSEKDEEVEEEEEAQEDAEA